MQIDHHSSTLTIEWDTPHNYNKKNNKKTKTRSQNFLTLDEALDKPWMAEQEIDVFHSPPRNIIHQIIVRIGYGLCMNALLNLKKQQP